MAYLYIRKRTKSGIHSLTGVAIILLSGKYMNSVKRKLPFPGYDIIRNSVDYKLYFIIRNSVDYKLYFNTSVEFGMGAFLEGRPEDLIRAELNEK